MPRRAGLPGLPVVLPVALLAALFGVAGCAPAPEMPILGLGHRACDAQPVLDGAIPVPLGPGGAAVHLGLGSRCLADPNGGADVTYAVFRLPDASGPTAVTVSSVAGAGTLVSPRVAVVDEAGGVRRTLGPRDFQSNVSGLRAGLRTQPDERYVVASADPATLGQPVTLRLGERAAGRVQLASRVIVIPAGRPDIPEQQTEAFVTFSLNGTIRVSAVPVRLAD